MDSELQQILDKLEHEIDNEELGDAKLTFQAVRIEAEALETYAILIARGMSDAEARGTAWPQEAPDGQ